MNPRRRGCLALGIGLAALAVSAVGALADTQAFRLLSPFSGAVVHSPQILLVFATEPGVKVLLHVDGKSVVFKDTPVPGNDDDLHHIRLTLEDGRHQVRILDAATEGELGAASLTYIPSSSLRTTTGKGDQRYYFHTREREAQCRGCHSLPEMFETLAERPMAPAGKVCGACHPSIESATHLHGPVAVYECFKCHGSDFKPSRFVQKTSQAASCSTCHADFLTRILGGSKFVHGPVATGVCIVCHDPHGAENAFLLVDPPEKLCTGCHADTLPLPVGKGLHAKLPCTKCHSPHGASEKHLTAAQGNKLCQGCHAKAADPEAGHPMPGHPVEASVDPSKPGQPMGCRSCHDPHGLKDISKADIRNNDAVQRTFCRRCHY